MATIMKSTAAQTPSDIIFTQRNITAHICPLAKVAQKKWPKTHTRLEPAPIARAVSCFLIKHEIHIAFSLENHQNRANSETPSNWPGKWEIPPSAAASGHTSAWVGKLNPQCSEMSTKKSTAFAAQVVVRGAVRRHSTR